MDRNWIGRLFPPIAPLEPDASGDRLLERQSHANERNLAYLRAASASAFVIVGAASWTVPRLAGVASYPASELLWLTAWMAAAIGFVAALRRGWFPAWIPWIVPAVDALVLWLAATRFLASDLYVDPAAHPGGVATLAVLAALLGFSGAFRLRRGSALFTTFLAVVVFGSIALATGLHPTHSAAVLVVLLIIGLLGIEAERGFRRTLAEEVARRNTQRQLHESELATSAANEAAEARERSFVWWRMTCATRSEQSHCRRTFYRKAWPAARWT
jgi:hypothetical protein